MKKNRKINFELKKFAIFPLWGVFIKNRFAVPLRPLIKFVIFESVKKTARVCSCFYYCICVGALNT